MFTPGQVLRYGCRGGYERRGDRRIRCSNNQWEWVDPSRPFVCRTVTCRSPPHVPHGSYPGNDFSFAKTLNFTCDVGYKAVSSTGLMQIICQPNGMWTVISARCENVKCPALTAPQHGSMRLRIGNSELNVGTVYSFECDHNFLLRGFKAGEEMRRRCLPDGTWDNVEPECLEIHCSPLILENGRVDLQDLQYGSIAEFECDQGFVMIPPPRRMSAVCMRNGQWSVSLTECKPDHCGRLPQLANTVDNGRDWFSIDSTASYMCVRGYTGSGGARMKCTYDGWQPVNQWTSFYCLEDCSAPTMNIPNAKPISDTRTYPVNQEVNMACNNGYTQKGDNRIKCLEQRQADGTRTSPVWSWVDPDSTFECLEKCRDPTNLDHIKLQYRLYDVGEVFNVECASGFSPPSETQFYNKRLQCERNRQWIWLHSNDPAISCHANCRNTPTVAHSIPQYDSSPIGRQVSLQCSNGYMARGNNNLKCTIIGWEWIDLSNRFHCEKVISPTTAITTDLKPRDGYCQRPSPDQNVVYFYKKTPLSTLGGEFDYFPLHSILTCVCASPGERFIEGQSNEVHKKDIWCQGDGWDGDCKCTFIPRDVKETPRVRIRNKHTVLWNGAALIAPGTRKIILDCEYIIWRINDNEPRSWLHPNAYGFRYQLKSATEGPERYFPENRLIMNHTLSVWKSSGGILYKKAAGIYTCQKRVQDWGGHWHIFIHAVELLMKDPFKTKYCPNPGQVNDGSFTVERKGLYTDGSNYKAGTKLKFKCNDGFVREGVEHAYCLNDGTWSHDLPTCRQDVCQGLPNVADGIVDEQFPRRNNMIRMKCRPGFTHLTGSGLWRCERGKWVIANAGETELKCENEFCTGVPSQFDQTCDEVFVRGENVTHREVLFTGHGQVKEYYMKGSIIGSGCGDRAEAWTCNGRTWEIVHLCHGGPRGNTDGDFPLDSLEITTTNGDLFLPGTPWRSNDNNYWICNVHGTWTATVFCQGLPNGHQASCTSTLKGKTLTVRVSDSWMATDEERTYFTPKSLVISKCGSARSLPTKWSCETGTWHQWENCDALPYELTNSGSHMTLHPDESKGETTWPNGRTLKMKCTVGYALKPGSGDSWTCRAGDWKKSHSDRSAPECQQEDFGVTDECDTSIGVPNASGPIDQSDYEYDLAGNTVYIVTCNDNSQPRLSCVDGKLVPDITQICPRASG